MASLNGLRHENLERLVFVKYTMHMRICGTVIKFEINNIVSFKNIMLTDKT